MDAGSFFVIELNALEKIYISKTLLVLIAAALAALIVVKVIHKRVSREYISVLGMGGLTDEKIRAKDLRAETLELEREIKAHESAIDDFRKKQNLIQVLSGMNRQ